MQLRMQRSQRTKQGFTTTVIFCLDVRAYLTPEESANVTKYGLSYQTLYNSEAAQRRVDQGKALVAEGSITSGLKGIGTMALSMLHLRVTVASIVRGQHIECKTLDEMLDGEEAIILACQHLKQYLEMASTFDGREVLFDFSGEDAAPKPVVTSESLLQLPAPEIPSADAGPSTPANVPMQAPFAPQHQFKATPTPLMEYVNVWWQDLSSGQKIAVVIGGLFALYVITHLF